jgi:hypothetical protein
MNLQNFYCLANKDQELAGSKKQGLTWKNEDVNYGTSKSKNINLVLLVNQLQ